MEALASPLQPFFQWLWQTTVIASLVICLILAAQKLLGNRLGPRWSYALWLVLLIRMVIPWAPPSRISLLNLLPSSVRQAQLLPMSSLTEQSADFHSAAVPETGKATTRQEATPTQSVQKPTPPRPQTLAETERPPEPAFLALRQALPLLWLAGATLIGAYLFVGNFALWRIVKRDRPLVNQSLLELFEECKAQMGVQTLVAVVPSSQIRSPALFGFMRPRLLLPHEMIETTSRDQMRYVFLHELAHLKRHDIYLGWLMSLLQVLHWFNPLVWLAFHQMRSDRELACDALVLARTGQQESQEYGRAIVALLRCLSRARPLPAMAGILENKTRLKRRMTMIAKFKTDSYRWSPLAVALIVLLCCISLPDAKRTKAADVTAAERTSGAGTGPIVKTVYSGKDLTGGYGVLSPDESKIAYCARSNGVDVCIKELQSGRIVKPTNADTNYHIGGSSIIWSPDSKWIACAYYSFSKSGSTGDLRMLSATGGEPKILHVLEANGAVADWSKDGKYILSTKWHMTRGQNSTVLSSLVALSVESGEERELMSFPGRWDGGAIHPRFSPDGKYVVYGLTEDGNTDVFVLEVGGTQMTRLTDSPAEDTSPIWSPDGQYVLFSTNRRGAWDLWAIAVKNGRPAGAAFSIKYDFGNNEKHLTANGKLVFNVVGGSNDIYYVDVGPTGDTLGEPQLIPKSFQGHRHWPMWSPDGKKIAYLRLGDYVGDRTRLCILSLADGREECIAKDLGHLERLFWAPDGKSIALIAPGFRLLSLETGEIRTFSKSGSIYPKGFSADGKEFIVFDTAYGSNKRNVAIDVATGAEREILFPESSDTVDQFDVSPDRKRIVYLTLQANNKEQTLVVADIHFNEKKTLVHAEYVNEKDKFSGITYPVWSPDGTKIAYTYKPDTTKSVEIGLIAPDGSWQKTVNTGTKKLSMRPQDPPVWSPDGAKLAFNVSENLGGEIGVLENFLPATVAAGEPK